MSEHLLAWFLCERIGKWSCWCRRILDQGAIFSKGRWMGILVFVSILMEMIQEEEVDSAEEMVINSRSKVLQCLDQESYMRVEIQGKFLWENELRDETDLPGMEGGRASMKGKDSSAGGVGALRPTGKGADVIRGKRDVSYQWKNFFLNTFPCHYHFIFRKLFLMSRYLHVMFIWFCEFPRFSEPYIKISSLVSSPSLYWKTAAGVYYMCVYYFQASSSLSPRALGNYLTSL